jgi:hypothetical protein
MNLDQMIEVLQAAKRGEKIEVQEPNSLCWTVIPAPGFDFKRCNYRIAPKKEMTLVEELREVASKGVSVWGDLQMRAADRIEELEQYGLQDYTTDELLAELKRRTG